MAQIRSTIAETIAALANETARMDAGTLELHPGTFPTDGDILVSSAASLVIFTLGDPAFALPTDIAGSANAVANPIADSSGLIADDVGFAVFRDSVGTQLHIVDTGLLGSGAFVQLDDLTISVSEAVSVTAGAWRRSQSSV